MEEKKKNCMVCGKPMALKGHYLNTMVREGGRLLLASNAGFVPQAAPGAQKPAQ